MSTAANGKYPLYFTSVNCRYNQESISRPDGFKSEQLMFILEGEGILKLDGKTYPLYPDTAVYISSDVSHSYRGYGDNFVTAWITYRGQMLPFLHGFFNIGKSLVRYNADTDKYILLMKELTEEYETRADEGVMSSVLYRLITEFFSSDKNADKDIMEKAELYIIRNFSERIYLEQLCVLTGCSKSKLSDMAKKCWGMTVFQKIMDIRLSHAKSILEKNNRMKLSECALRCGFEDVSYFCKCYKKKYGTSPKSAFFAESLRRRSEPM